MISYWSNWKIYHDIKVIKHDWFKKVIKKFDKYIMKMEENIKS